MLVYKHQRTRQLSSAVFTKGGNSKWLIDQSECKLFFSYVIKINEIFSTKTMKIPLHLHVDSNWLYMCSLTLTKDINV